MTNQNQNQDLSGLPTEPTYRAGRQADDSQEINNLSNSDKEEIEKLRNFIQNAENQIKIASELLEKLEVKSGISQKKETVLTDALGNRIIEGAFDGENMLGDDGGRYPVPPNYASKSKLVEGDRLKLTIQRDGSFIYKQIGPVERKRVIGILSQDLGGNYLVLVKGKAYRVLKASVTYFKAKRGDHLTILIPHTKESAWAAVENIITAPTEEFSINDFEELKEELKEEPPPEKKPDIEINFDKDSRDAGLVTEEKQNTTDQKARQLEEEWIPDLEEIKKEAFDDSSIIKDDDPSTSLRVN